MAVDVAAGGLDTIIASTSHTLAVDAELLQMTGLSFVSGIGVLASASNGLTVGGRSVIGTLTGAPTLPGSELDII